MSEDMKDVMENGENKRISVKAKKWWLLIGTIVVVIIAVIIGIGVIQSPERRLQEYLDMGYHYLENEQYEEAVVAFERAIEIDERCIEAYAGGIQGYQNLDNLEELQAFYERAQNAIQSLDEVSLAENLDYIVDVYLAAPSVYEKDPERAAEILEKGLDKTEQNSKIKEALDDIYISLEEISTREEPVEELAKDLEDDLSWARELYDALAADDFDTVIHEIENWQAFIPKCEPYLMADWAYWDYENAYRIPVSETEVLGVVVYMQPDNLEELSSICIFIGGWDDQEGFECIGWGDKMASYAYWNPEEYQCATFDGVTYQWYGSDEGTMTLEENEGIIVWHVL